MDIKELPSELLTSKDVCSLLQIHPNTLRGWEKEGIINGYRLKGKRFIRYKKSEILKIIDTNKRSPHYEKQSDNSLDNEHLALFPQFNPNPVIAVDSTGNIIFTNNATSKVMRQLGEKDLSVFIPADINKMMHPSKKQKVVKLHYRELAIKNHVFAANIYISKKPHAAWIYTFEITNHINTEKELEKMLTSLQESEARYHALFWSAADAIVIADSYGKMVTWNRVAKNLFGYSEKEVIGQYLTKLMPERYKHPHTEGMERLRKGKKPRLVGKVYEVHGLKKDGTEFPIELSLASWRTKNNEYFIGIIRDITERKLFEKQKDEFFNIASHELKTPITAIQAFAEIIGKHADRSKDVKMKYFTSKITSQVNSLNFLINNLLDVSRINTRKLEYYKTTFNFDDLIQKVLVDMSYMHDTHHIIRKGEANSVIYADKNRIYQVLSNLIINAIKYSPEKDKIIVHVLPGENTVTIGVQDFGIGISKAQQQKIFSKFYQAKAIDNAGNTGLGLGLFIASEIIEHHKGKMWVKSKPGKGSTFYFSLPVKTDSDISQLSHQYGK